MSTLGWVFLAIAFLIFIMVANNSWQSVWTKIRNTTSNPKPSAQSGIHEGTSRVPSAPPNTVPQPDTVEPGQPSTATA